MTPDGAYGGPVRVSLNQASALRIRGHSVTLAGAEQGFDERPEWAEGNPLVVRRAVRLLPRMGFAGLSAPGLLTWFLRNHGQFQAAHIHLARDLVLLPLAMAMMRVRLPYVLQTHGMILPGAHPLADHTIVRKLLCHAHEVFYLTTDERDALDEIAGGNARLTPLPNGVPLYPAATHSRRVPEVLYLSRLHSRKRPVDFITAANELNTRGVTATYTLVGADEGEGRRVQEAAARTPNITWEGPVESGAAPARMRQASMYVLPSLGPEPYPMAVLEAMSVGLPVVVTDQCGVAPLIRKYQCGIVIEPGPASIARAVEYLLSAPDIARSMGERGRSAVKHDLGMSYVGQRLEMSYAAASHDRRWLP
ncbi:MAG: glycosyltransferase [Mycobacterium kyogaense]|uniref:glycosyltransferase n=1 Tax=Mycobacterium kyogaense TaxID=2212479 RepID=UPI002FFBF62C